ncbi:hemolymph lipopolysaccharide-binding protein-like isoform X2 [Anabrus simplex]|uniref:hemolymph lipopolysaccharide-binding protein-like isoform X2 n=1 Tax=Anabrus simplex TaxID=316456 RepID=UPI0035A338CE
MNSMITIPNFILLLLPACLVHTAESETFCSAMNGESLRYTVRSRKNETSHRIVSVDLQKDSVRNKGNNATTGDVDLDVAHTYLQCSGKERIMLSTIASTELKSSRWREDHELFPGLGFYKLHTNAVDWETARSICVREGGHLIVINSDAEPEVVKKFFSRKPKFTGARNNDYVFVGVHDYLKDGQYMAVTGEPLDKTGYSRWAPGEPNQGSEANYVVADKDGLLYDAKSQYGFICEQQM